MNYMLIINDELSEWANQIHNPKVIASLIILEDVSASYKIMNHYYKQGWNVLPNNTVKVFPSLINLKIKHPQTDVIEGKLNIEEFLYMLELMEEY
ncbi:MAG: hypothetical protein GOVbin1782_31 [Prokaryotic dsDNA virus sp.]|nr:MAG: hypothetical protein GOVbin1782_31 [Prokaryotic dsDNA virus sp.]|tara:strand:+ start:10442 stop:10726 length:285 start_codon:yes stop_codon:yes gene_type:complete